MPELYLPFFKVFIEVLDVLSKKKGAGRVVKYFEEELGLSDAKTILAVGLVAMFAIVTIVPVPMVSATTSEEQEVGYTIDENIPPVEELSPPETLETPIQPEPSKASSNSWSIKYMTTVTIQPTDTIQRRLTWFENSYDTENNLLGLGQVEYVGVYGSLKLESHFGLAPEFRYEGISLTGEAGVYAKLFIWESRLGMSGTVWL